MKLYFAGNTLSSSGELLLLQTGAKRRLFTYWELKGEIGKNKVYQESFIRLLKEGNVFIDSGAYSAKTHNQSINIQKYCDYLQTLKGNVDCAACLDVIGNHTETQRNYEHMSKYIFGFPILNVVHLGAGKEQIKDAITATVSGYIGVGGLVGAGKNKITVFLNRFWSIAKDYPKLKVHGFGIGCFATLCKYPFYSSDSTSAIVGGGMGRILSFSQTKGLLSHRHKSQKHATYKNIDCIDKEKSNHMNRRIMNIRETLKMEEYITRLWAKRGIVFDD